MPLPAWTPDEIIGVFGRKGLSEGRGQRAGFEFGLDQEARDERRAYRCPECRAWHLTSQPKRLAAAPADTAAGS